MTNDLCEPWYSEGDDVGRRIYDRDEVIVQGEMESEYARRIVACVNACAGIPTEKLEDAAVRKDKEHRLYALSIHARFSY